MPQFIQEKPYILLVKTPVPVAVLPAEGLPKSSPAAEVESRGGI
jgi:hypothetical protein